MMESILGSTYMDDDTTCAEEDTTQGGETTTQEETTLGESTSFTEDGASLGASAYDSSRAGEDGSSSLLLNTNHDTVNGTINLLPSNGGLLIASSRNGSLIHEILELPPRKSRGMMSNGLEIYIGLQGLATGMDSQDASTSLEIGKVHSDLPVETTRSQQGQIQNIHPVGGGNGDDSWVAIESVHLHQQLVDGLLTLVVSAGKSCTTLVTYSINLINEDDAGRVLLSLAEDVTDTGRSHTHEHLNEFRTRDGDERDASFSGHGFGKEGLTCGIRWSRRRLRILCQTTTARALKKRQFHAR